MIFVTVGTHEQPFNRLIQKIDELKKDGIINEDVIIQTGFSTYEPKYCQWSKLIPYQQMVKNVADARIVITHGGPASFVMPLQIGKTPIVVPRQHQFDEHVNDHQVDFSRNVAQRMGTIILVEDIETLGDIIKNYDQIVAGMNHGLSSNNAKFNKSKKNNNDRTQYRQKNHHEAIVSREVFNAANHLRASRNYSKKNRPLPVLSVVEDGILRGYVPFDKDWTGFSAEEYREASESVMKEPDVTVTADVKKRLDLTGYEIVRVQYFSTMQNPAMTISNGRLRFNTACLKKFENVEYVELLLNSVERCIAIRPCDKNNPNAIRWGRLKEGRWCASTLGCRGLAKTLFDIMEWDEDLRYRFRGQFLEQGDNKMMLFAFDEPEMIKVEEIVLPPKENTEEDEGETVKKKIYIFPPEWAGTFGQPITSIAQVGILRQEHYAGNWDVFRPATEIEEMNIFTAESLNELLREAEKIMEGWTDYR